MGGAQPTAAMARAAGARRGPGRGAAGAAALLAALLGLAAALALLAGARAAAPGDGLCSGYRKKTCNTLEGCAFAGDWGCLNMFGTKRAHRCDMWFFKKPCVQSGCAWTKSSKSCANPVPAATAAQAGVN